MIDLDGIIGADQRGRRNLAVGIEAAPVLFLPQFVTQQFLNPFRRAAEKCLEFRAHAVMRLVALLDPARDLVAFLGALADIAGEFEMDALRPAEFMHHHLDLLQHLAHRLARDRVFHVLEPHLGARGMVEAGFRAGFGIDEATRQMRHQPARRQRRNMTGAAEPVERAVFRAGDQLLGDGRFDQQCLDASAD